MCEPAGKYAPPAVEGALMAMDAAVDFAARISGATTDIATRMTGAIRDAARQTGAGFEYLLNTAIRESNLNVVPADNLDDAAQKIVKAVRGTA